MPFEINSSLPWSLQERKNDFQKMAKKCQDINFIFTCLQITCQGVVCHNKTCKKSTN